MARSEHFDTLEQAKAAFKDCQPCGEYVTIGEPLYKLYRVFPDGTILYRRPYTRAEILEMDDLNS